VLIVNGCTPPTSVGPLSDYEAALRSSRMSSFSSSSIAASSFVLCSGWIFAAAPIGGAWVSGLSELSSVDYSRLLDAG
jgi:hypothetical protein